MERSKRVYKTERQPRRWLSGAMLFLSALVLLSGLATSGGGDVAIEVAPTATPIPMDAAFDETAESREIELPARSWYALQLGAFEQAEAAEELAARFRERGAAGYVWHDERYRALAALYAGKDDAQNVRKQLVERHTIETWLFQIDLPAVRLRVNGMRGQLDILEAAFGHMNDLVAELQALGVEMDRQEKNAEEAKSMMTELRTRMETASLRLKQRFASPRHDTVEGLVACLDDYVAFAGALPAGESAVELAARVKRQTLQSLYMLKCVYDGLFNT